MGERTRLGLWVLGAALILGVSGDVLLRGMPWGINIFLMVAALVVLAAAPLVWSGITAEGGGWLVLFALFFAAAVAWRASPTLAFLNVCGVLVALSLAAVWGRSGCAWLRSLSEYALGGLYAGAFTFAGPLTVMVRDVEWGEVARGREPALAVVRGLFIAAPLLLLFGGLFVAADEVFEDLVRRVFEFDVAEVSGHLLLISFFGWMSAGYLRVALLREGPPGLSVPRPAGLSLGTVELGVILGLLNALFATFVTVQVRYFFGGTQRLAAGLAYAEYARHGFFELVTAIAFVLPVLLLAHWLLRVESGGQRRVFDALAVTMVMLVFVIMASALWRMYLYYERFGLTELRLYSTFFMFWLALILALFLATVLRDRRDRFGSWTLVAGFAAILFVNVINPDALIARANITRMEKGKRFDPYYLMTLSADAAPVLLDSLPEIGEKRLGPDRTVEQAILDRWQIDGGTDWRTWNLSRARAQRLASSYASAEGGKAGDYVSLR